jgi:hypothetical protein
MSWFNNKSRPDSLMSWFNNKSRPDSLMSWFNNNSILLICSCMQLLSFDEVNVWIY